MLKISAQFSSKFQTLENQFEQGSGRFVDPEPPFKMGPQIRAEQKKTKTPKKMSSMKPNASFCRKEPFWNKKKLFLFLMALGGWKQQKTKTSNRRCAKKHYKQGVLFVFVLVLRYSFFTQNNITTKQNNIHKTTKQQTTNNQTKQTNKQTNEQTNNKQTTTTNNKQQQRQQQQTTTTTTTTNNTTTTRPGLNTWSATIFPGIYVIKWKRMAKTHDLPCLNIWSTWFKHMIYQLFKKGSFSGKKPFWKI